MKDDIELTISTLKHSTMSRTFRRPSLYTIRPNRKYTDYESAYNRSHQRENCNRKHLNDLRAKSERDRDWARSAKQRRMASLQSCHLDWKTSLRIHRTTTCYWAVERDTVSTNHRNYSSGASSRVRLKWPRSKDSDASIEEGAINHELAVSYCR